MNKEEEDAVTHSLKRKRGLKRILGENKALEQVRQEIENISSCDVSVLILGESGTGKELAARAIHYLGSRAHKSFVPVNCGSIPENLFENELFGHRKGAFTDASYNQVGLVKEADGGTLFLDEVGVIPSHLQVKLLRLLQDKEYKPLGDSVTHSADIRIIAATNEDLIRLVKKGIFREDFYYRLNIVSLYIPPLRERKDDLTILVDHFIKKYSNQYHRDIQGISEKAMKLLISYSWPGNIRELENVIQQSIVISSGNVITAQDIRLFQSHSASGTGRYRRETLARAKKRIVNNFEREYLTTLLTEVNGDMLHAAVQAGTSRTALWNLLAKHHLHPRQFI
jgi:transcriptional regulator with PAS, ATPase and Fis domain